MRLAGVLLGLALLARAEDAPVSFAKPQLFAAHFATGPRLPVAVDADGDGFCDLACVHSPDGGILDVGLSVAGLRMRRPKAVAHGLLGEAVAAAARGSEIAWLTREGTVGLFSGGEVREAGRAEAGATALLALDAGWLVPNANGIWVLAGVGPVQGPQGYGAVAAHKETIFWTEGAALRRGALADGKIEGKTILADGASSRLLAGDFDGDGVADVLSGDRILPGSGAAPIPVAGLPAGGLLLAGDFTRDGRSDLVWCRKSGDRHIGQDILLYVNFGPGAADPDADGIPSARELTLGSDPLARDSDNDMLPDGWEAGAFAGLDFAAEGFSPAKPDILCLVQRSPAVDGARMRADLRKCRDLYASLGISLHFRFLPPLPAERVSSPWWECGNAAMPDEWRGIAHYVVVTPGGGGQSAQLGDMGGAGADGLFAAFLHEFGHQLGLDHTGFFPEPWCPLYTSLMNYAFSHAFDGDSARIHYSRGEFAAHALDESALVEALPFPIEKVGYLAKPPFEFRLQAAVSKTLIDWNRNGRFDEGPVRADINTSYSTDGGRRVTLGKTVRAPVLVSHEGKAFLFAVNPEGKLESREYQGNEAWSAPAAIDAPPATGDPAAVSHRGDLLLFLPVAGGVWCNKLPALLPGSDGCEVSAATFRGALLVGLWREGRIRFAEWGEGGPGPWQESAVASTMPPAAVEGPDGHLWVGVGEKQDERREHRWKVYRFDPEGKPVDGRWVGGAGGGEQGNRRPNLLFLGDELHFLATGLVLPEWGNRGFLWDAVTIGDRSQREGWLVKRFYDEWTASRSPMAACVHGGEILLAFRWLAAGQPSDDDLMVAHRGSGIGNAPMADFDDVGFLLSTGIPRSILFMAPR